MNNKGFTLVELLATIVLLVLITFLASFTVNKITNDSKKNSHNAMVDTILSAGITYVNDNDSIKLSDLNGLKIYLSTLVNGGYIDNNLKDPLNNKVINMTNSYVNVSLNDAAVSDGLKNYKYSGNYLYELNLVYN